MWAGGFALAAAIVSVLAPSIASDSGLKSDLDVSFVAYPQDASAFEDAVGTNLFVWYDEDVTPLTYGGLRELVVHVEANLLLPVDSGGTTWIVDLPEGATGIRTLTESLIHKGSPVFGEWAEIPKEAGSRVYAEIELPQRIMEQDRSRREVWLAFDFKMQPPVVERFVDNWEWREAWAVVWQPELTPTATPTTWSSIDSVSNIRGDKYVDWSDVLSGQQTTNGPSWVVFSVCASCGAIEAYGAMTESHANQHDGYTQPTSTYHSEWSTSWFPWQWATALGLTLLVAGLTTIFISLINGGVQATRLRPNRPIE